MYGMNEFLKISSDSGEGFGMILIIITLCVAFYSLGAWMISKKKEAAVQKIKNIINEKDDI